MKKKLFAVVMALCLVMQLCAVQAFAASCGVGNHKVDGSCKYDMADGKVSCKVCSEWITASGSDYSGLMQTTDGRQVILKDGVLAKGEFTAISGEQGEKVYHSCASGYASVAAKTTTATCVKRGVDTYTCSVCQSRESVDSAYPVGHDWNDKHICRTCGFVGVDITGDAVTVKLGRPESPIDYANPKYSMNSFGSVYPYTFAKHGDRVLTSTSSLMPEDELSDMYISWVGRDSIGKAEVIYQGIGNYYGEVSLTYYIYPATVGDIAVEYVSANSAKLVWNAAAGAEYYDVYVTDAANNKANRKWLGNTKNNANKCEFVLNNLEIGKDYYYVVAGAANVAEENKNYYSLSWSAVAKVNCSGVTAVSAEVDDVSIAAVEQNGANYLFLPATADLSALSMDFVTSPGSAEVTLSGDKGAKAVKAADAVVDVTAIATAASDGGYSLTVGIGSGHQFAVKVYRGSGLPTMYLTSADAGKDRIWVDSSKSNKATGSMRLFDADGRKIYDGDLKQIKARGNSTFSYAEKKAYQIKLSNKADLLGNDEKVKTWVLLAGYFDATMMHDKLFKDLAAELGMDFTPSADWVNLYYDGEYRGVYLLSEKNSVGKAAVDITDLEEKYEALNSNYGENAVIKTDSNKYGQIFAYTEGLKDPENLTGGYLIELNLQGTSEVYGWDEVNGFGTARKNDGGINVKSPEWGSKAAIKYISEYYQEFEDAVYATDKNGNYTGINPKTGKSFDEYVDMESLVQVFLMQELGLNPDGFMSSLFFYKDIDGIMYAGPVWDMDLTLGTAWTKYLSPTIDYDQHYLAEALIKIPKFKAEVCKYCQKTFLPEIRKWLDENNGVISQHYDLLKNNATMNYVLWPYLRFGKTDNSANIWQNVDYPAVISDMKDWVAKRVAFMGEKYPYDGTDIDDKDDENDKNDKKDDENKKDPTGLKGDINNDGRVNSSDAVLVLRHAVGYELPDACVIKQGDMNGDGRINSSDAVAILRYAVGYRD